MIMWFALATLLSGPLAHAVPATPIRITDSSLFVPANRGSWFLRADTSTDVGSKGTQGWGVSIGRMGQRLFYDLSVMSYKTRYGALRVYQSGANAELSPLSPDAEIGRLRLDDDEGSLFSAGLGVGFVFKLFHSEHWVELGRFGLSFASYSEPARDLHFHGALASFHGAFGYRFGSMVLAPGLTWNLGYVQRSHATSESEHENFLPIQWWAFQLSAYVWMF